MAIYRCEVCDEFKDGDYNVGAEYKDGRCCDDCTELVICGNCWTGVEEGELNGDGECTACAYATETDKREAHADDQYTAMKEKQLFGDD